MGRNMGRNMGRKILSLVLALTTIISCMPVIALSAYSGSCGENLAWSLVEGTLTISGSGDMTDYTYDFNPPWNSICSNITNIIIENGVTSIGNRAFMGCKNLTGINIPQSMKSIGKDAFINCESLTGVYISDLAAWCNIDFESAILGYAQNLYLNNELVTNLTIPDGVTSISKDAFFSCISITELSIPQSVTSIGEWAFAFCLNLTDINISDGVKSIGDNAFYNCISLLSIDTDKNNESYMSDNGVLFDKEQTIIMYYPPQKSDTSYTVPDGVTNINYGSFSYCKNLENINISDSVNSIGGYAFEECSNLTSLTIPDGITTIEYATAVNCEKLTEIKLPDSITSISSHAFDGTAYYNDTSNWTDDALYIDNYLITAKKYAIRKLSNKRWNKSNSRRSHV